MFRKLLIANRGEIAVRIIRACRDMGISPVAVFSEADRAALHVRLADEAYLLGPAPSSESYLAVGKILETARRCGADSIHPGYGFLAENPRLAAACADAGIAFVGPSAESMRLMGSKTGARRVLQQSGVPIVPGTYRALGSVDEALVEARQIGYPVMIKASEGGGGKGMRLVADEAHLAESFTAAGSEAQNAFGAPSVYLEKYISRPRHVEIQVLADRYGHAVYLGERECSVQRRHQKVIEESPSPAVDESLRRRMGEAALRVVAAAKYQNAGTVEFLLDDQRNFFFLEMNTRIQVEHPVTEVVTGFDLVKYQLLIAAGEPLDIRQEDVRLRGWAMECRIYAEDPERDFFPCPGVIRELVEPSGPGVRLDSGVYPGWNVPIHYDPLLAKLITCGADREQAVARMRRAIAEYRILGIRTNLGFFGALLSDADFISGRLSTNFIDEFLRRRPASTPSDDSRAAASVAAALAYADSARNGKQLPVRTPGSAWKLSGRAGGARVRHGWRF